MDAVNPRSINRRRFLITAGAALAAPALSAKTRDLHKAIMYATIGFKGTVMEKFQAVKEAGFEGIEPMSHMTQSEVLAAFAATGLALGKTAVRLRPRRPQSGPRRPHPGPQRREGLRSQFSSPRPGRRQ
jgi:hypothetical protein